jgi:prolipoprotein diacylglyceryltransferase
VQENLAIALIVGVVAGGRIGYFLMYEFGNLVRDPLVLFRVWEGGMLLKLPHSHMQSTAFALIGP